MQRQPNHPSEGKVAGSWAVVQQRHSQLQCSNMVKLKLSLLQSILDGMSESASHLMHASADSDT